MNKLLPEDIFETELRVWKCSYWVTLVDTINAFTDIPEYKNANLNPISFYTDTVKECIQDFIDNTN